ncbi:MULTISPECIES: hypothetical protein [Curvivirga]|uniref:hypothetical protein n=1 Tax=Curvivirga TaxID=2856846 RepID=UPI0012BB7D47|nr:hypothetical protein [Curvivirga aplysinae]MTI11200.1 hypothetical protein [Curvivirga aplysinae]
MTEETVDYTAEANLLIEEMNKQPDDVHEIQIRLRQKISMMRAEGLPIPENFIKLEAELDKALTVED